jgi:uncharacterized membrane protein YfhO
VTATAPSLVVVRNSFDNGWEAKVDGRTVPVLAADYFLQAVAVPRGHHEIELAYRDPKIGEGLAVSTAVWIALAVGALAASVASRVVRRRRGAAGTPR